MGSFIQGLLLGYGASVPIGPINILLISYAIQNYWLGFFLGLGAMSADMLYLGLILLGVNNLDNPILLKFLSVFSVIFLLILAILSLRAKPQINIKPKTDKKTKLFQYLKGLFLTLSNPYTIGFWISVSSLNQASQNTTMLLLGLVLAIFSWIAFLPFIVHKNKNIITAKIALRLNYISGIILIFFAALVVFKWF